MSNTYSLSQNCNSFGLVHRVKSGETACSIAKKNGLTLKTLKELNPNLDLNCIKAGQTINLKETTKPPTDKKSVPTNKVSKPIIKQSNMNNTALFPANNTNNSQPLISFSNNVKPLGRTALQNANEATATTQTMAGNSILTLDKFEKNMSPEAKLLKPFTKKKEGKVTSIYIAPEGKATIGHGHLLINKPKFLLDIESQKLSHGEKMEKVKTALLNKDNQLALKESFQKDLLDAIKTTGIKNVPATVNKDLVFTNEQIELLFCSDVKKAQDAMTKVFGKDVLSKRTVNQKLVVLDLCFNSGGNLNKKTPEFVKQFKAGNMANAQAELNIFKSNDRILLGLIRRNYNRMLLLNDNKLSPLAKERLLAASNEYLEKHDKELAKNFTEAEKLLKKS